MKTLIKILKYFLASTPYLILALILYKYGIFNKWEAFALYFGLVTSPFVIDFILKKIDKIIKKL